MTGPAGLSHQELGGVFGHPRVAAAYVHRPDYPAEVFDLLERLVVDDPRVVLDLGAGDGAIARPLAPRVDRVDAVDISAAMVEAGRKRPGGREPRLRWIVAPAETAPLDGPYALATAGASLHWMDWEQTTERLAQVLSARAQLAIIEHGPRDAGWQPELTTVIRRHSRNPGYDPHFSLVDALQQRGLFATTDSTDTSPVVVRQKVGDYVEQLHSTATLAREHMSAQEARDFDDAVERAVRPWASDGVLELTIVAHVTWGRPRP